MSISIQFLFKHFNNGSELAGEFANTTAEICSQPDWEKSWHICIYDNDKGMAAPFTMCEGRENLPIPAFRWALGHTVNQSWKDLQFPLLERIIHKTKQQAGVLFCPSDRFLYSPSLKGNIFESVADKILTFGFWKQPGEIAQLGCLLCRRETPHILEERRFNLSENELRTLETDYLVLNDSGICLISAPYIQANLQNLSSQFRSGATVATLPDAKLFSLKTSQNIIASVSSLMNLELDESKLGLIGAKRHPNQYLQNTKFSVPLRLQENHTLWVENSFIPESWKLASEHIFTGVPQNNWNLHLQSGICFDFVPIENSRFCLRFYKFTDNLCGNFTEVCWMGNHADIWFTKRNLKSLSETNIFADAKIFPVFEINEISGEFLEWLISIEPSNSQKFSNLWNQLEKISLNESAALCNLSRLKEQRSSLCTGGLKAMLKNCRWSVFHKLDLENTAELFASNGLNPDEFPMPSADKGFEPLQIVHDKMFRSAVLRHKNNQDWQGKEKEAFRILAKMLVEDAQIEKVNPTPNIIEDQIVWGRCPLRLDLAGGWSDTPPYCLQRGGKVVNLAVNINGQQPIQVFVKLSKNKELVVRSIDQGAETHITNFEDLRGYAKPGDNFALVKAGFAQAGFLPEFFAGKPYSSLEKQLTDFGAGIELSLLSAVPKGSGLGTSSILAATVLAALGATCGLKWDKNTLFTRTMALEQMLTTGGGWQDQAGGIYQGIKLIETSPGLKQTPTIRWLPDYAFQEEYANKVILLYYTGITRIAKGILQEIVRGIFLNSPRHLETISEISENAETVFDALQQGDYSKLASGVRESFRLNCKLDSGTNPIGVQNILAQIEPYMESAKLLGAGGGGYLLIFAKDPEAAIRIKKSLRDNPPNKLARFVDFNVSQQGLEF